MPSHPAPTVRRHMVVRQLLLSRKRHPEDWAKLVDSQERVICPGSGLPPKLRSSKDNLRLQLTLKAGGRQETA